MNITNLFTKTTTVEISVVTIDKKKLTKSIITQIVDYKPFDEALNIFEGVKILGFVNGIEPIVIWTRNGELNKCNLNVFRKLDHVDIHNSTIENLIGTYQTPEIDAILYSQNEKGNNITFNEYRKNQISSVLSAKGLTDLKDKKEEFKTIISEIYKRQIFI